MPGSSRRDCMYRAWLCFAVPGCLGDLMLAVCPAVSCTCTTMCHLRIEIGYCWMVRVIGLAWAFAAPVVCVENRLLGEPTRAERSHAACPVAGGLNVGDLQNLTLIYREPLARLLWPCMASRAMPCSQRSPACCMFSCSLSRHERMHAVLRNRCMDRWWTASASRTCHLSEHPLTNQRPEKPKFFSLLFVDNVHSMCC